MPYCLDMTSLAKRERFAIAQTLRNLGPNAPTLCDGWTSFDLLVHLVSRENRPDAALGILIPAFSQYSKKIADEMKQRGFETLVQEFENGPKQFSPFAIPGIDTLANSFEFLVHHEDLLRAQQNYVARVFGDIDKKMLWKRFTQSGRIFLRKAKVGIIAKSDQGIFTIKSGNSCVTMEGDVVDLILYSFGRKSVAKIKFEGDEESIRILKDTKFGL